MNIEQWANETAEILSYWFNNDCKYEIQSNISCRFNFANLTKFSGFISSISIYPEPIDSAIYLSVWFLEIDIPF